IDLVEFEEFRVVAEVPQEPVELPQVLCAAGEPGSEPIACKRSRLYNQELNSVERFLPVPTILDSLDTHQEQTVSNGFAGACAGLVKAGNIALHAAPACGRQ